MTSRELYAQLAAALIVAGCSSGAAAAQPRPADPPCGACTNITVAAAQTLLLPDDLNGVTILLRTRADADVPLSAAIEAIRARRGTPGVLHVRVDDRVASIDQFAFELKQELTEYRAAIGSSAVLALAVAPQYRQPLIDRGLAAYTDLIPTLVPASWFPEAVEAASNRADPVVVQAPADAVSAREFLGRAVGAAVLLPRGLTPAPGVIVSCGGKQFASFRRPDVAELVALTQCGDAVPIAVTPAVPLIERFPIGDGATIARFRDPSERFATDVQVTAGRRLSVEEVIARHQAVVRRQAGLAGRVISTGSLTLTFEAPSFAAPVTIASQTTVFTDGTLVELEQRDIRVNGIRFDGRRIPRLPILEPERVASLPLTINLTDQYRYRLSADDSIDGQRCYVVAFEPLGSGPSFRGRAWIAMESFAMVRVAAVQTGLRGAIVSSEQVDEYRPAQEGVWLLARSDVRQVFEGAAHRTPIHRRLAIVGHEVNPPDFEERRAAAHAGDSVMLRDTPEGFRYLRRTDEQRDPPTPGAPSRLVDAAKVSRVRTLAAGVIVDPNISRPLPFAGVSYVDFDLFGTGTQLNGFFGGAYGQVAISVPSLRGSRWQLAGRGFAIATSYNDRSFHGGRERYDEAVRQRPAHASVWLMRPITPLLSLRAGYDLDYTRLRAAPETAADFTPPADQVVHAARVALEGQRGGWTVSLWWNPARRRGWRAWGRTGDYDPGHATFQRAGLTIAKATALSPRLVTRIEGQWMDGRDLDRFSRYSFGTFDNRLRGYPSALVRYDRGGVVRGAAAWSVSRFVRLDGFVDTAAVRDRGYGTGLRNYTGVGAAVEAPAPFGLLTAVEWGYGFRGVNADGGKGTQVVRVSVYKVF